MEYANYTSADFCADPFFLEWALSPVEESQLFWNEFRRTHPEKEEEILAALAMLNSFEFAVTNPSGKRLSDLKSRIENEFDKADSRQVRNKKYMRYAFAACVAVFMLVGGFVVYNNYSGQHYETAYGELKEIKLSEGSVIVLNAGSSINVREIPWGNREVELNGEAHFNIAKIKNSRFVVKTGEARVEVLGTQFSVHTRRENTTVVLSEGKVTLSNGTAPAVYMKPGEMAVTGKQNTGIVLQKVKASDYLSWMDRQLILNNMPVSEALLIVRDFFGIEIQLAHSELLQKKLNGTLPLTNISQFAKDLAIVLDLQVMKTQDGYRLY